MTSVRFDLPDGYALGTWHRGFVFTSPPSRATRYEPTMHFADDATRSPFPTPGAAVRAIIEHDGVVGSARERLLAQIAALPERYR